MTPFQIPPGYEHVAPVTERVGAVTLLHDHYFLLNVAVNKVGLKVVLNQGPPQTPIYGARYLSLYPGKLDAVGLSNTLLL